MNIAFSALLILVLALPGISFLAVYRRGRGKGSWTSITDDLPYAVFVSAIIHAIGVPFANFIAWLFGQPRTHLASVVTLLVSPSTPDGALFKEARDSVATNNHPFLILLYFFFTAIMGAVLAALVRRLARSTRIDRRFAILEWNCWYYLLGGKSTDDDGATSEPDAISIAAVVGEYLYRGILVSYFLTRDGDLESLVLQAASRRKLGENENPHAIDESDAHPPYYYINAENFVLKFSEVSNIAVTRMYLPDAPPESNLPGAFQSQHVIISTRRHSPSMPPIEVTRRVRRTRHR